jgi:hypothetical protein
MLKKDVQQDRRQSRNRGVLGVLEEAMKGKLADFKHPAM